MINIKKKEENICSLLKDPVHLQGEIGNGQPYPQVLKGKPE